MNEQTSIRVTDFIKIEEYCGKDTTEVLTDQYEELYKERIQVNQDVATAQEKYNEALKKCSEALKKCSEALEEYSEALAKYYEVQKNYDEAQKNYNEVLPRPHKVIGKPCGAKIYKKHIYFHCRSMLR